MKLKAILFDTKGSVLMETLLVLPVYLIALSGVFWIGELALARLTLVQAEQTKIWERSYRAAFTKMADFIRAESSSNVNQDRDAFFWFHPQNTGGTGAFSDVNGFITAVTENLSVDSSQANSWGRVTTGNVTARMGRSVWSWAISSFFTNDYFDEVENPAEHDALLGRTPSLLVARPDSNDNPKNSLFLSRGASTNRDGSIHQTAGKWNAIYLGSWNFSGSGYAAEIQPVSQGTPNNIDAYGARDSYYNQWSI